MRYLFWIASAKGRGRDRKRWSLQHAIPGKYSSPLETTPSLPTSPVPGGRIDPLRSGYHLRRGDPPSPGVPRDTHEQAPRLHIADMRGRTNISTTSSAAGATSVLEAEPSYQLDLSAAELGDEFTGPQVSSPSTCACLKPLVCLSCDGHAKTISPLEEK